MIESLLSLDREVFLYLNNLGSEPYDGLWKFITKQINWLPFFLILAWLIQKSVGWKRLFIAMAILGLMMVFTDQTTNLVKYAVQRTRPCSNPELEGLMREVISRKSFSFFSGHACNSMAAATFIMLMLRPYYKYVGWLVLWPLIFAYSRIYLGVHYPGDILVGFMAGATFGWIFHQIHLWVLRRFFPSEDTGYGQPVADRK
jgi:undecaprenyl-diphosphatase